MPDARDDEDVIERLDAAHAVACSAQREMLRLIARVDRFELWRGSGARDTAHFVCMRYGISEWKARRWVRAAHALGGLPRLSDALARGEVSPDKAVELARFATPTTEARLIRWARRVSGAAIRRRGDLAERRPVRAVREAERERTVRWWHYDQGIRFHLEADLSGAEGTVVAKALDRMAETIPEMPGEEGPSHAPARRADALVAMASMSISADPDPDRATVVIHAHTSPGSDRVAYEIEGGPALHPETARRLLCHARVQGVIEDSGGNVMALTRMRRDPPAWMLRQLRYRDHGCQFPGCGTRRFVHAHHIVWWERGGRTSLDNLVLVCSFHHRLVHEHAWRIRRGDDGVVRWFLPDGTPYQAGPGPPGGRGGRTLQLGQFHVGEGRRLGTADVPGFLQAAVERARAPD
jgi:Domain of unknown function (DUF222)/HNH endonuclease